MILLTHNGFLMALITGDVETDQMIQVSGPKGPRRDIVLWSRVDNLERPECRKVHELIRVFMQELDASVSTLGLGL